MYFVRVAYFPAINSSDFRNIRLVFVIATQGALCDVGTGVHSSIQMACRLKT
jgi:hypothetical protein